MLQRISLTTADGRELFSGVSLLRSEPPPPMAPSKSVVPGNEETSGLFGLPLASESAPSNDNGSHVDSRF